MEKPSLGVFFDSDFATIDSLLAVALVHGMHGKKDCQMAIVTMSRPGLETAAYVDMVERYYRGPAGNFAQVPPVGMPLRGRPLATPAAYLVPLAKKKADDTPAHEVQVKNFFDTADPNTLIRNYLEAQYDGNGAFVLAGPATTLAASLDFPGMKQMIAAKIRYLVVAGGAFPDGPPEANVAADIPAAQRLFAEWPTPIVASGHEIGSALRFPGASIDKEFVATSPDHPVADAYRAWRALPYDAPTGAMAAALYAGRAKEGYFQLSDPGVISAGDDGRTSFTASATGKHRYLILDSAEKDRILQDYVELASAKPVVIRRRFIKPDAEVNPAEEKKAADHGDEAVAPKPR